MSNVVPFRRKIVSQQEAKVTYIYPIGNCDRLTIEFRPTYGYQGQLDCSDGRSLFTDWLSSEVAARDQLMDRLCDW